MPDKTLGEVVRELREAGGLTPAQLAEKAQVARSLVLSLEAGSQSNPSRQILYRLTRALDVPAKRLLEPGS
jgi:transcriptional regulator with XRE-family HTH domain